MINHHQQALAWSAGQGTSNSVFRGGHWLLLAALVLAAPARAVENNDYTQTTPIAQAGNGINVDPATGNVMLGYNHAVTVWPKGPGGQTPILNFAVQPSSSPSGAVLTGGTYYVPYFWYYGEVHKYDATGQDQGTAFVVNPGGSNNDGIWGMVGDSAGHLAIAARNLPGNGGNGVLVTDLAGNIKWQHSISAVQTAVDAQNNVYVGGPDSNVVQVYDPNGNPLRTIGPIANGTVGGLAVDQRGNVYISNWIWNGAASDYQVEKYNAAGTKVATLTGYGMPGGNFYTTPLAVDPSGRYVYVMAQNGTQTVVFEETMAPPPAPTLSATGSNPPATIQASWPAPASPVTSYSLEISTDQSNWTVITVPGSDTSRSISAADFPGLAAGTYYLRISATDPDGTSPYSGVVTVVIPAVQVPPNPAAPAPVPGLGEWALATLAMALAALGWRRLRG